MKKFCFRAVFLFKGFLARVERHTMTAMLMVQRA
jgi:hypothetical protein